MNDIDIENLLQSLPPATVSAALQQRVQHELDLDAQWLPSAQKRPMPRWIGRLAWSAVGAAAVLTAMALTSWNSPNNDYRVTASPAPSVMPVHTIREVVSTEDEGIRYNSESKLPEQHLKVVSVERHAWIDPRDGAEITVEVPREDNLILPASFQ